MSVIWGFSTRGNLGEKERPALLGARAREQLCNAEGLASLFAHSDTSFPVRTHEHPNQPNNARFIPPRCSDCGFLEGYRRIADGTLERQEPLDHFFHGLAAVAY
jgi:hypothetical protein